MDGSSPDALDLSLCSDGLLQDISWSVIEEFHLSDHFPILISLDNHISFKKSCRPYINIKNVNWKNFTHICNYEFYNFNLNSNINIIYDNLLKSYIKLLVVKIILLFLIKNLKRNLYVIGGMMIVLKLLKKELNYIKFS